VVGGLEGALLQVTLQGSSGFATTQLAWRSSLQEIVRPIGTDGGKNKI
jgi:hypothetical protein